MKNCKYSKRYIGKHYPKCNNGNPCDVCLKKYRNYHSNVQISKKTLESIKNIIEIEYQVSINTKSRVLDIVFAKATYINIINEISSLKNNIILRKQLCEELQLDRTSVMHYHLTKLREEIQNKPRFQNIKKRVHNSVL